MRGALPNPLKVDSSWRVLRPLVGLFLYSIFFGPFFSVLPVGGVTNATFFTSALLLPPHVLFFFNAYPATQASILNPSISVWALIPVHVLEWSSQSWVLSVRLELTAFFFAVLFLFPVREDKLWSFGNMAGCITCEFGLVLSHFLAPRSL